MRIPREMLLIVAVLAVVAVLTQQVAPDAQKQMPDLASDSSEPGGAKALYLWLQSLGYAVERLEYRGFRLDDSAKVAFLLGPTMTLNKDDLNALHNWVERGGILIIAGSTDSKLTGSPIGALVPSNSALPAVLREFNMSLSALEAPKTDVAPTQPLLLQPVVNTIRVEAESFISGTADLLPYLGDQEHPIGASLMIGKGQVHAIASSYAFSNEGLGQADNAKLLLNWLPAPANSGTVVFDEIHHGYSEDRSLTYMLVHEPWGWGAIYMLGVLFAYLALDGRRFGKPVPSVVDTRRVASEYVSSLAGLLRRGGKSTWVAQHYEHNLRRALVAFCDLDPALGATALGEWLGRADHLANGMTGKQASGVLLELHEGAESTVSEKRLVRLAAEAGKIIDACGGRWR